MKIYRGFDPSAVYFCHERQFYAIRPELIPLIEVGGVPREAIPITDAEMGRVIARTLLNTKIPRINTRKEVSQ